MSFETRIQWKFRWLAWFYDLFDLAFLIDPGRNPRSALVERLRGSRRILDVCTGTARNALLAAEEDPSAQVQGIDLSPGMLQVAQRKIRERGISNLVLHCVDARQTTLPERHFDVVMVSFALHEMDASLRLDVLREMSRVLSEDGRLLIVDYALEGGVVRRGLLRFFLWLFEPASVREFLREDWATSLAAVGCQLEGRHPCAFSELISARKRASPAEPSV